MLYSPNITENCTFSVHSMSVAAAISSYNGLDGSLSSTENCFNSFACIGGNVVEPQCGLTVRVEAALILAICLLLKAFYMIFINVKMCRRTKTQCVTFGDVIVASAIDSDLRVRNECMVNAGEAYRQEVKHACHKHCSDKTPSISGDGLGHCQKCLKHNSINKAADLPSPVLATKYKKSLLANLGSTSLIQIILLVFCSMAMLGCSLMIAVSIGIDWQLRGSECLRGFPEPAAPAECQESLSTFITNNYGGFGGFNTSIPLVSLPADSGSSEMVSFWISNGAQLIFSLLYLLLIYNITLISMEYDWGMFEKTPSKLRCTLVKGSSFRQSYTLQLPKRILFPAMAISAVMHWLLGQSVSTVESMWQNSPTDTRHSVYTVDVQNLLSPCTIY